MSRIHKHSKNGRKGLKPKRIVLHAIGENIRVNDTSIPVIEFMEWYGVSAHSLIMPNGDNIRTRNDDEIAWHCKGYNSDSLGIEFVVAGTYDIGEFRDKIKTPYLVDGQLEAGLYQVREWLSLYSIESIDCHSELDPERKTDPGAGFPLAEFLHELGR